VAVRAARHGAKIAVVARRKEALDVLTQEVGGGTIIVADLSASTDCARIAEEAGASLGKIDVVLFTAATARLRTLKNMTADEWAVTLNTNLVGVNLTIAALLPYLSDGALVVWRRRNRLVGPSMLWAAMRQASQPWKTPCGHGG